MLRTAFIIAISLFAGMAPFSAEAYTKGPSLAEKNAEDLQSLRESISLLRHKLDNQQVSAKTFEERLLNFETMLESFREDVEKTASSQKESLNAKTQSLELRLASLEKLSEALSADIKLIGKSFNDTLQTIKELESSIAKNNRNLSNMQNAVSSLLEALQPDTKLALEADLSGKTINYKIKNGDSLEKIAKNHRTTVQSIKELNQMTTDKIIVGKTIKIPKSS